ncbi:MAG: hypothetical protein V4532_05685, partial [Pseudomonadota bacterium]
PDMVCRRHVRGCEHGRIQLGQPEGGTTGHVRLKPLEQRVSLISSHAIKISQIPINQKKLIESGTKN